MIKMNRSTIYLELYLYKAIYKARKLIVKRNCIVEELDEAAAYLKQASELVNGKDARIDVLFGKLEFKRSRLLKDSLSKRVSLSNAKNSFFVSLEKGKLSSAYYGLFKISVEEADWTAAKKYIDEYIQYIRKKHYNFNLVYKMLDILTGTNSAYQIVENEYILANRVNFKALIDNYKLAEEALSIGDNNRCLKHLLVCQKLANIKGITIDFSPLIEMMKRIIKENNIRMFDKLNAELLNSSSVGERIEIIRNLLRHFPAELELYFMLMDCYIELGVYSYITEILVGIPMQGISEIDIERIGKYKKLVSDYEACCQSELKVSKSLSLTPSSLASSCEYSAPGNDSESSFNAIQFNELGDLLYNNGYYPQAEQYYLKHITTASAQLGTYVKLYKISRHLNDFEKSISIVKLAFENLRLNTQGYTLESLHNYLEQEFVKESNSSSSKNKKVKQMSKPIVVQ